MMLKFLSLGAAALFLTFGSVEGQMGPSNMRQPASVSYQARINCPALCSLSGPTPANWTVYQNLDQLSYCQETVFYHMSIYDSVDDGTVPHRIYACTSFGAPQQPGAVAPAPLPVAQTVTNATFTLGAWNWTNSTITPQNATLSALSQQMRKMFAAGYAADNNTALVLFAQSVSGTAGLYLGKGVQLQQTAANAMVAFEDWMMYSNVIGASAGLEFCQPGYDADHVFGFIAISNTSFAPVQQALQSWANATCLTFDTTVDLIGTASFTTPLIGGPSSNGILQGLNTTNTTSTSSASTVRLARRGDCTTVQVVAGDSCGSLATKCGITAAEFTTYNPSSTLCSRLSPGQHVCCSPGTLPDFAPKPNSDGSCATYKIVANDNCDNLAAANSLTADAIENFNKNTWAWNGCSLLYVGNIICLSSGTPPMPAPLANALCGPQVPGTAVPASGTANVTGLNPCPLNACCDVWGQCGITAAFCTDTNTGAPGTAKPGTNGCISNCGTQVVQGAAPASFISLAYYEGFGMDRPCLYQDVRQIDTTQFTHLHFAFGTLNSDYSVSTGDAASTYQFNAFTQLTGVKRVLSFGGWAFSTDPTTYSIFRTGVTAANRVTMARSIANFITQNNLDGVDIDWEYPGEPDIPGIPADSLDSGANYLAFLVVLKNLLPGKTVSIAAPASYWYLKAFPIAEISKVVDYIVFMTYDLHGQWDAGNKWSQDGCADGNCLRSHVNLTETMTALAMITKAGVASNKVVVGVSSYGRSFAMADASCYGPTCFYTGTASQSNAEVGPCTGTAGYISDAEVNEIITNNASRINQNFLDPTSNSRIVVYDNIQWVAMMDDTIRSERNTLYTGLNMGGSTNWASDLETYNNAPGGKTWPTYLLSVKSGIDPWAEVTPTGNWTDLTCTDESVENLALSPSERWSMFDGADAWTDIINVWNDIDSAKGETFTFSIANSLHTYTNADCGALVNSDCDTAVSCSDFPGSGNNGQAVPAVYEIWNSFVVINQMYVAYHEALVDAVALVLDPDLKSFEQDFAPVPPPAQPPVWETILLTVLNLVGTIAVSSFFNSILKALPIFAKGGAQGPVAYDNYKDAAKAFVSFSASLTGEVTKPGADGGTWSIEAQDAFSDYLGQVVFGWSNLSEIALQQTFSGNNASVAFLTSMLADGNLIQGNNAKASGTSTTETNSQLASDISKAIFAFAIPALWPLAKTNPFVLDSGYNCGDAGALTTVSPDVQQLTGGCYNGKQYYLVWPTGSTLDCQEICTPHCSRYCQPSNFSAPPGLQYLDGTNYGGIKVSDLIIGSVRTYEANGNANGGAVTDPTNPDSLSDLINIDVTTPGFVRIPVCSGDIAYAAWREGVSTNQTISPNYPCFVKPSPNKCGISTFVDETSSASPLISDCLGIVKNIQGTQGEWEVENAVESQHQIVQFGGCKFGVQGRSKNGNIDFHVGAQDIVDVIKSAISQFGGSGTVVGAKGVMSCKGDVSTVPVEWGLY